MQFSVQSIPMSTRLRGFTSALNAHEHLFKHVIPMGEHLPVHRKERWEELIDERTLIPDVERRVEVAASKLAKAEGCPRGQRDASSCDGCYDGDARWEIDLAFQAELAAYVAAAQAAIDFAFTNRTHTGEPRAVASRTPKGWQLETVDPRGVRLYAGLPETGGEPAVVTCYRDLNFVANERLKKRYDRMWLDLNRQRAGSRRNGTALELELAPGGGS